MLWSLDFEGQIQSRKEDIQLHVPVGALEGYVGMRVVQTDLLIGEEGLDLF